MEEVKIEENNKKELIFTGKYSGCCDLYDTIMMLHLRTKDGSDKKEDLEKSPVLYSDELECFNEFKEKTGGVIHQHQKIKVTLPNQELVEKKCESFKIIKHIKEVEDKRFKDTKRADTYYTYEYWGKEYKDLKELNKKGVYITLDIPFNTILDIIPYYPYLTNCAASNENGMYVVISNESYVETNYKRLLEGGLDSNQRAYYNKQLQEHYIEVVQRYYTPKESIEVIEEVTFDEDNKALVRYPIDERFGVEWDWLWLDEIKPHWDNPHIVDAKEGIISQSEENKQLCGNTLWVKYYKYEKPKLYLD